MGVARKKRLWVLGGFIIATAVTKGVLSIAHLLSVRAAATAAEPASGTGAPTAAAAPAFADAAVAGERMSDIQVIGSHNSYKLAIEPALLELVRKFKDVSGLEYSHPPIPAQLDTGLRALELDFYYDPVGGTYAKPRLNMLLLPGAPAPFDNEGELNTPGLKVMHNADLDFRSHHHDLKKYMEDMKVWSLAHSRHLPVFVTMNCEDEQARFPGAVDPVKFDDRAFALLDETILSGLGRELLFTPDDLRGSEQSVKDAVLKGGWRLEALRGKFVFLIDETGHKRDLYLKDHPGLRGGVCFTDSPPESEEGAFLIRNDPIEQEAEIRALVAKGYIVRTRADANTTEARANNYDRFEAAKRSGAQIISTDYFHPDPAINATFRIVFDGGSFVRRNPLGDSR